MPTTPRTSKYDKTPRYKRRHENADRFANNKLWKLNCKKATPWRDMRRNCAERNPTFCTEL